MKKLHGPFGLILAMLLFIMAGAVAGYMVNGQATATQQGQMDQAAEGKYLAYAIGMCAFCHTPPLAADNAMPDWARLFAGGRRFEGWWGVSYSANLTPDSTTGILNWTDKQIAEAVRNGRKPDGNVVIMSHPWQMFHGMAASDVQSIIAYLRTLKPIKNEVPLNEMALSIDEFKRLAGEPALALGPAEPPREGVERGRYLANVIAGCSFCHSAHGLDPATYLAGGFRFTAPDGTPLYSRNITPDPETGLGKWTDEQIVTALQAGLRPDGQSLSQVMPRFVGLTESDLQALLAFLHTVPPLHSIAPDDG